MPKYFFSCLPISNAENNLKRNPTIQFFFPSLLLFSFLLLGTNLAYAQSVDVTGTTPRFGAGHNYIGLLNETVNPANGNISLRIPIETPPGRGIQVPFNLSYDSANYAGISGLGTNTSTISLDPVDTTDPSLSTGGWTYSYPHLDATHEVINFQDLNGITATCLYTSNFVFTDLDGGKHSFNIRTFQGATYGDVSQCGVQSPNLFDADGEYQAVADSDAETFRIADKDSTVYSFGTNQTINLPISVEDRNGNIISAAQTVSGSPGSYTSSTVITDSANRPAVSIQNFGTNPTATGADPTPIVVSGTPGQYLATWTKAPVTQPYTAKVDPSGASKQGFLCAPQFFSIYGLDKAIAIQKFTLPDGLAYQFEYEPVYGLLSKITYPSGAYISYEWSITDYNDDANFTWSFITPATGDSAPMMNSYACHFYYGKPVLTHRSVSYDGATVAIKQDFTYTTKFDLTNYMPQWTNKTTTVQTQDYIAGTTDSAIYSYIPNRQYFNCGSLCLSGPPAVESSVVTKDASGNVLRTQNKTWLDIAHISTDQTITENNLAVETDYDYSSFSHGISLLTEQRFYDYGSLPHGPLLSKIVKHYDSGLGISPNFPSILSLLDFPSSIQTYDNSSSISPMAETDYTYTSAVSSPSNGVVQHDPAYEGSSGSNIPRGNVLTATRKCLSGCNDSVTAYAYDYTGQVTSSKDSRGNTTYYSYDDNYSSNNGQPSGNTNTLLTKVTRPPVNGHTFIKTYQYGYLDGNIRKATDENGQATIYCYLISGCSGSQADPWLRPTEIDFPDNGKKLFTYSDSGINPYSSVQTLIDSTHSRFSKTITDGMGRTIETQESSVPATGTIYQQTTFDGKGQTLSVSNPYYSMSDDTYGVTSYTYDALGRRLLKCQQDNGSGSSCASGASFRQWQYAGNSYTLTDENAHSWTYTNDGLNRMTKIKEPNQATTTYTYDAISNLNSVNQSGISGETPRLRTFTHDSLSRIICASNPENSINQCPISPASPLPVGVMAYSYDGNSNLISRTDARGITTNYNPASSPIDALNRVTEKVYSDGTPTVTYKFDDPTQGTGTNTLGRMTGATVTDNFTTISKRIISSYDPMGRIALDARCDPGSCNLATYQVAYTYDFTGNETSATENYFVDSSGNPLIFNYNYDAMGRFKSEFISTPSGNYPNFVDVQSYTPWGDINTASIGWAALPETHSYDKRQRVTHIKYSYLNQSPVYDVSYMYDGTDNVKSITDTVNGGWTLEYDPLNRLSKSTTSLFGTTIYGYDGFGNRINQDGPISYDAQISSQNRVVAQNPPGAAPPSPCTSCYDAAGNLIEDVPGTALPHTYAYDAEGRLRGITDIGISYSYDAEGNRIGVKQNGNYLRTYIYEANGQFYTNRSGANGGAVELFGGNRHVATLSDTYGTIIFPLVDSLGTERVRVDFSGIVQQTCTNLAFGDGQNCPNTDTSSLHLTGKERDSETGLDYFGARYYTSSMGRFNSPDPSRLSILYSNPQTWNRYSYVFNNPLSLKDVNGKWPTPIHNQIIDMAFPRLSAEQRQILKNVSASQDNITGQSKDFSYTHAMRSPDQTVEQAQKEYEHFVSVAEMTANNLQVNQLDPESETRSLNPEALAAFGQALHAVVDSTSPAHEGFQMWDYNPSHVLRHSRAEKQNSFNLQRQANAISAAQKSFQNAFGYFGFQPDNSSVTTVQGDGVLCGGNTGVQCGR